MAPVAEQALTLETLVPLVRHIGDAHRELQAWRKGEPFRFAEPRVG